MEIKKKKASLYIINGKNYKGRDALGEIFLEAFNLN